MNLDSLRGKKYGVEHLLAEQSGSLHSILHEQLSLTPERIAFLQHLGAVYCKNQRCLENVQVEAGTYLRVHQEPRRFPIEQLKWPEALVFENPSLLVVHKPCGLPVHSTVDNIQENLCALLKSKTAGEVHVTHRLDVATEGLLVLAKTKKAQSEFNILLMKNQVRKIYRAKVHGVDVPLGKMTHWMEPSPRAPKKVSSENQASWIRCELNVLSHKKLSENNSEIYSEIQIELLTGRTHQIRSQLSASGFPIVGDISYGSSIQLAKFEKICLQACELSFPLSLQPGDLDVGTFEIAISEWNSSFI